MSEKRIGVRIENSLKNRVENIAKKRGENLSTFVRRAILRELAELSYLPRGEKKALGIERGGGNG